MPSNASLGSQAKYDSRWFIWTIVFLVVTGISLVSYIVLSDNGTNDVPEIPIMVRATAVGRAHVSPSKP